MIIVVGGFHAHDGEYDDYYYNDDGGGSVYDGGICPTIDHPLKTDQKSPLARITL